MRVMSKRWGEVTVKKQGQRKNQFDHTKSFSIESTPYEYDASQLKEVLEAVVNLTQRYDFDTLRSKISDLRDDNA
jgi:hypothetical protein